MQFQFSYIALFICLFLIAGLGACTHQPLAGAYGSARGPSPVSSGYHDPIHTLDDCNKKQYPQCSGGN